MSGTERAPAPPLIKGQGTPETRWQQWPGLRRFPHRLAESLVPTGHRAVMLSPHPDDEILAAGGLLAMLIAAGRDVVVVGASDGGASHPGSALWTVEQLADLRRQERDAGLACLGAVSQVLRLGLPDGELQRYRPDLVEALHRIVRPGDVVLAPWRHDGHPDHEAVGEAAAVVCARQRATLVELPIWMWHWAEPGDPRVPWHRARQVRLGDGVLALKQAAIGCHRSQLLADASTGAAAVLPAWALERWMRQCEVVFVA